MDNQHENALHEPGQDATPATLQLAAATDRLTGLNQRLALLLDLFSHAESQRRLVFEERIFELRSQAQATQEDRARLERTAAQARNELATMSAQAARFAERSEQCMERLDAALRVAEQLKRELAACRDRLAESENARHEAQDTLRVQQKANQELKGDLERLQRQWQQFIERDR